MTTMQKVIKYLALCLAFFIIAAMLLFIMKIGYHVFSLFGVSNKNDNTEITTLWKENGEVINNLKIDLRCTDLTIKTGDKLLVETNNSSIKYEQEGDMLNIREKKNNCLSNKKRKLIVTITESLKFDNVDIDGGAGTVNIDNLDSKKIEFDLGAGDTTIKNINTDEIKMDTGAGSLKIDNGIIHNLDLDLGVGETTIVAQILGNSKLDTGVGELNLNLFGIKDDYKIKVSKGLGEIKIDNVSIKDGEIVGAGTNFIDISGGIGQINISYIG